MIQFLQFLSRETYLASIHGMKKTKLLNTYLHKDPYVIFLCFWVYFAIVLKRTFFIYAVSYDSRAREFDLKQSILLFLFFLCNRILCSTTHPTLHRKLVMLTRYHLIRLSLVPHSN